MNKLVLSISLTLLLIGYVILDLFINDDLWSVSTSFALSMQEDIPAAEQIIYEIFTYIVFIPPIAAVYCFVFGNNKLNALLYLSVTVMSVTANEILKNLYHQARPYMIEMQIQSLKCNSDYGKPSGHSMNSVVMIFLMPFLLFPQLRKLRKSEVNVEMPEHTQSHTGYTIASYDIPEQKNNKIVVDLHEQSSIHIALKIVLILFFLASVVMTGISRVFLGVHSLGQVFLGWAYGMYIASMYIFVLHDRLKEYANGYIYYIIQLLEPSRNRLGESRHLIPMSLLCLITLLGLCLGLLKINYFIFYEDSDMNAWIQRINDCKNTDYTRKSPQILYNSCFQTTAICAIITGLLVGGILVQGSYQEGEFTKNKNLLTFKFFLYRILMLIAPFCILIPLIFINSENVVIQTITQILPLSFGVGLIINCIYPFLLRKFRLQIPGDFLYFDEQKFLLQNINDSLDVSLRKHENSYQNTL